jgi:hypothetical protein
MLCVKKDKEGGEGEEDETFDAEKWIEDMMVDVFEDFSDNWNPIPSEYGVFYYEHIKGVSVISGGDLILKIEPFHPPPVVKVNRAYFPLV